MQSRTNDVAALQDAIRRIHQLDFAPVELDDAQKMLVTWKNDASVRALKAARKEGTVTAMEKAIVDARELVPLFTEEKLLKDVSC